MNQQAAKSLSYEDEKVEGIRRQNGARNLSRLRPRHRQIIALHLAGHSGKSIAAALKLHESTVSIVLNDPKSQEVITQAVQDSSKELRALQINAVDAVRAALDDNKVETRLKGVDRFNRLYEVLETKKEKETAEDAAQNILASVRDILKREEGKGIVVDQEGHVQPIKVIEE